MNNFKFALFLLMLFGINLFASSNRRLVATDKQMAIAVYESLKNAIGDKRLDWPILEVLNVENRVASFVPGPKKNWIYIDQKAIDICKQFGDKSTDALAFLIGHELTHFYQEHEWKKKGFILHKDNFEDNKVHERTADIYGAFIAHQAGFNTIPLVPLLLERVYRSYQLSERENQNYPSLSERRTLASDACRVAKDLVDAYQTANYAMVIGKLDLASQLYDFVGSHIKFKELYHNKGLCQLLDYYYQDTSNHLAFPFQIDPKIPITRSDQIQMKNQLELAITAFEKVISEYDNNYLPTCFSLISAYNWAGKEDKAIALLQFVKQQVEAVNLPIYFWVAGNFYAYTKKNELAEKHYRSALNEAGDLPFFNQQIRKNQSYLEHGKSAKNLTAHTISQQIEKKVDGIPSLTFFNQYDHLIEIGSQHNLALHESVNSYLTKLGKFKLQRIYSPSISTSKGIRIGSDLSEIYAKYPKTEISQIAYAGGFYLVNFKKGLIFKCNKKNIIEEWVVFSV